MSSCPPTTSFSSGYPHSLSWFIHSFLSLLLCYHGELIHIRDVSKPSGIRQAFRRHSVISPRPMRTGGVLRGMCHAIEVGVGTGLISFLKTYSVLKSNILSGLLILVVDVLTSILRVPIRCLSCLGLCQLSAAGRFRKYALRNIRALGVRSNTDDKISHLNSRVSSLADELTQCQSDSRGFEMLASRLQTRLYQTRTELQKLKQGTAINSDTELSRVREALHTATLERDALRQDINTLTERHATQTAAAALEQDYLRKEWVNETSSLQSRIRDMESQWQSEVAEVASQRDDLRRLCLEHQTQTLAIRAHYSDIEADVQATRQEVISVRNNALTLEAKHLHTIRSLLLGLTLLWRFSHALGVRLNDAVRVKSILLVRFKALSTKKVEARRECVRVQNLNQELEAQLAEKTIKCDEEIASSQKWHASYYKSVKARDRAAFKFKAFRQFALQRFNGTATKLLTALLILWQQNAIVSARLAETEAVIRALQVSAAEAEETRVAEAADDETFRSVNLHPQSFSLLPRTEANALYAIQYRKYSQALKDYQQFVESCSTTVSDESAKHVLQESYDALQVLYQEVIVERDLAKSTVEELRREQDDLQLRLGRSSKDTLAVTQELEQTLALVRTKEEELCTRSAAAVNDLKKSQDRVNALQQQCTSKERSLQDLEARLVQVEEIRQQSQISADSLTTRLKDAQVELGAERRRHEESKTQLAGVNKKLEETEDFVETRQKQWDSHREELLQFARKTETELLETRKKLQASLAESAALQDRVSGLVDDRRSLDARTMELEKEVLDAQTGVRNAQKQSDQAQASQRQLQRQADKTALEATSQLLSARKQIQDLTRVVADKEAQCKQLREESERRQEMLLGDFTRRTEELDQAWTSRCRGLETDLQRERQAFEGDLERANKSLEREGLERQELVASVENLKKALSVSDNLTKNLQSRLQDSSETQSSITIAMAVLASARREERAEWKEVLGKQAAIEEQLRRVTNLTQSLSHLDSEYRQLLAKNVRLPRVNLVRAFSEGPPPQDAPSAKVDSKLETARPASVPAGSSTCVSAPISAPLNAPTPVETPVVASVPPPSPSRAFPPSAANALPPAPTPVARPTAHRSLSTTSSATASKRGSQPRKRPMTGGVKLGIVKSPKLKSAKADASLSPALDGPLHMPMSRRARWRSRTASATNLDDPQATSTPVVSSEDMTTILESPLVVTLPQASSPAQELPFQKYAKQTSASRGPNALGLSVPVRQEPMRSPSSSTSIARSVSERAIQTSPLIPASKATSMSTPTIDQSSRGLGGTGEAVRPLKRETTLPSLPDDDVDVFRPAIREALAEFHASAHAFKDMPRRRVTRAPSQTQNWSFTPPRHDFNVAGGGPSPVQRKIRPGVPPAPGLVFSFTPISAPPPAVGEEVPLLRKKTSAWLQMSLPQSPSPLAPRKSRFAS
ncbi:hypothetical protein BXZ70DRAFT_924405 [Cristinia sonorae]|uniref:Uncharacterized protein n=1 Tax=Cristinia sonorae TaxID=1940300 RepID=A0A8K0UU10_9AGAR|nr:hypothetical protein BXZ70DRAFT_924405 [Cristinia sonorae]